jgi:formate hydrogenlyase subunit 6/NADH:ubiquinone oxidoreductase subunit I
MCGGKPRVDLGKCIRCFCCQELCPSKAVKIKRLPQALSSVLRIVFFLLSMLSARLHPKP